MKRKPTKPISITLVAAVVALGSYLALSSHQVHSIFETSTPPISSPVSTGTIALAFGGTGATNALSVGASDMVAGDFLEREVTLVNTGTAPIATVSLSVAPSSTNALTSSGGLSVKGQTCSVPWSANALLDGGYTYSCAGTTTTVLAQTDLSGLASPQPILSTPLSVGSSEPVVFTVSLPATATNSYEGLSTALDFTFTAVQGAGAAQ